MTAAQVAVSRIRVLVGDPQPLFRAALGRFVRQRVRFALVDAVANGREALEAMRRHVPDVAVLDIELPELSGERVLKAAVRDGLATKVIFLSSETRADRAYGALAAGASGYLSKRATEEEIEQALTRVIAGQVVIAPELQTGVAQEIRVRDRAPWLTLTQRELAVLRGIARGRHLPEIGRELDISFATAKTHAAHVYEKLGVSERAAAVHEAMRRGLLD